MGVVTFLRRPMNVGNRLRSGANEGSCVERVDTVLCPPTVVDARGFTVEKRRDHRHSTIVLAKQRS